MRKLLRVTAISFFVGGAMVVAQEQPGATDHPSPPPTARGDRGDVNNAERLSRFRLASEGADFSNVSKEAPTDEEWKLISAYAQENFKNRWKVFERVRDLRGEDSEAVRFIKQKMAVRYRALIKMRDEFTSFYAPTLKQAKLEDETFGVLQKARRNPDNAAFQEELAKLARSLVEASLKQREMRLSTLQDLLDQEKRIVEDDRLNIDRVVERQIARLKSDAPSGGPVESGRMRGNLYVPDSSPMQQAPGSSPTTQPKNQ